MSSQPSDEAKMSNIIKPSGQEKTVSTSSIYANSKDGIAQKTDSSLPKGIKPSIGPGSTLSVDGQTKIPMPDSKKIVAFSNNDDDNHENLGSIKEFAAPKKEKRGTLDAKKIRSSFEMNMEEEDDDAKENDEAATKKHATLEVAELGDNQDENKKLSRDESALEENKEDKEGFISEHNLQKQASRASSKEGSFNSATGEGAGKEIVENWAVKLLGCKFALLGLGLNLILFFGLKEMASGKGFPVSGAREFFEEAAGLVTEILMNIAHIFTAYALQEGMSTYFGYLISQRKGYSIAVCAFCHSSILSQITFTSYLNYRSRSRKILSKASILIAFQTMMIFLTPFSSSFVYSEEMRVDEGHLSCIIYNQKGKPFDRGVPTLEAEFGVGEFIFGDSLGKMSSQMKIDHSVHVMPPQLIDGLDHETEIIGEGFKTDVQTTCDCPAVISASYLTSLGLVESRANEMLDKLYSYQNGQGMVNALTYDKGMKNTTIVTIFPGLSICGGLNASTLTVPVCSTVLYNHKTALVEAIYMNDGSPTSIAIKEVHVRKVLGDANSDWLYTALSNLLGGAISGTYLPVTYPGSTNTLLRWATPNLQFISSSSLPAGVETMFSILLRGAIQRSYSYTAKECEQNIVDPLHVVVKISFTNLLD